MGKIKEILSKLGAKIKEFWKWTGEEDIQYSEVVSKEDQNAYNRIVGKHDKPTGRIKINESKALENLKGKSLELGNDGKEIFE